MGSTRLPGKVLADLGGYSTLELLLARLGTADVGYVVVATSDRERDDPLAAEAERLGATVVRGSETDVLSRFALALDRVPAERVLRLTADCPLTDPQLVLAALALHRTSGVDYTSNTLERTFPDGLDVEVIEADALREADAEATDADEREHVTPFVYRRPDRYRLASLETPALLGHERWTLDTTEDLARLRTIVGRLDDPVRAGWRDVLAAVGRHGGPPRRLPAPDGLRFAGGELVPA
jgi:spore coat polysaccharide biosynthesis protein SpsF